MKENNGSDNGNNVGNEETGALTYEYDTSHIFSTREGQVAKYLAEKLNDMKSIRFYISVALEYSERYLMEIYQKVQETPEHNIKKSRGALFAYLVRKYEHFDTDD